MTDLSRGRASGRNFLRSALSGTMMLLVSLSVIAVGAAAAPPSEYDVKAAFIYNFAKYVEWPAGTRHDKTRSFVVGVLGTDPFGRSLDRALAGQKIEDRSVVVRRFKRIEEVSDCQILFIATSERAKLPHILEHLGTRPVLTIGEYDGFAARGGMINLTTEQRRVRFTINVFATKRAGLKPAAQLLRLARIVEGGAR